MSNGINVRQNKMENHKRLAAQREIYSMAKRLNFFEFIALVGTPLLFTVLGIIFVNDATLQSISCITTIVLIVLSVFSARKSDSHIKTAAAIQQEFDLDVYQMIWDQRLYGSHDNLDDVIGKFANQYHEKYQNYESLRNWYSETNYSCSLNNGIFTCQRSNVRWDQNIRKIYRLTLITATTLCILGVMTLEIIQKSLITDFLLTLFSLIPLVNWIVIRLDKLSRDIKRLDTMKTAINSCDCNELNDLELFQKKIYVHRQEADLIPDRFYNITQKRQEREMKAVSEHLSNSQN